MKRKGSENLKIKLKIALCEELVLGEAMDVS
jgi:hypothetical protein